MPQNLTSSVRLRSAVPLASVALLVVGAASLGARAQNGAASGPAVGRRINFQPDRARVPEGFATLDSGEPFDEARGFGWVERSSGLPVSQVGAVFERGRSVAPELDTGIAPEGDVAWEHAVPNGEYVVTVSAGDVPDTARAHVVRVEGAVTLDFQSTSARPYTSARMKVIVKDGRLTIDTLGGIGAVLNHVSFESKDTRPPKLARPESFEARGRKGKIVLSWNEARGAIGYHVYRSTTLPVDLSRPPINGFKPVERNAYEDASVTPGVTYYYRVAAIDTSAQQEPSVTMNATATSLAVEPLELKVNFQDATSVPPTGYMRDYGQPFGARTGSYQGTNLKFGWVTPGTTTPVNLVGYGRVRTGQADQRLATLMHMQSALEGSWEIEVPNGSYHVTIAVGDPSYYDSTHVIYIEGQLAVNKFVPKSINKMLSATKTVTVSDGRLTIAPKLGTVSGTSTKITHAVIRGAISTSSPAVTASTPVNGATNVAREGFVSTEVRLPNVGHGVDDEALNEASVKLTRTSDGAQIAATINTSGGGDVIVVQPTTVLASTTKYTFTVNSGVTDTSGAPFTPFTMSFTTGTCCVPGTSTIKFAKVALTNAANRPFTSAVIGPDNKLYAGTITGEILRFGINADGTLQTPQIISSLQENNGGGRALIGLAFDPTSTATNLVLWTSHNAPSLSDAPDWSGKITRLSGSSLATVQDWVVGLPRSIRDHLTNSVAFGPDGALYVNQGSISAMGAPDNAWGQRPERLLSGAVLRIALGSIATRPLNVKTGDGGTYNPFASGAPLTVHASGVRNAYDLVWHTNGRLYVPTNGSAAGGATPATPAPLPAACSTRRIDGLSRGAYTGPSVPGIANVTVAQNDYLFRVVAGGSYGHPNPERCEWVLNGGNPTSSVDKAEVTQYPVGTAPDRNWRGAAFDFQRHYSPNGVIEYRSGNFSGGLRGKLLVVRYSGGDDIIVLTPNTTTGDVTTGAQTGISGFTGFADPLDLVENRTNGMIYVTEYGGKRITLLRPQ